MNPGPCQYYSTQTTRLEQQNATLNALVYLDSNPPASVHTRSLLNDLKLAVKDNICTRSMPTTCSSMMLREFQPPFDATVVKLLRDGGASIIGKTNCDEFGMGSLNVHSVHGPVVNPYIPPFSRGKPFCQEQRSAGGSSGGSAAAVAAHMCDESALGTDTGGSVRLPASYCGIVGFKPSYGLISRWGVVSYADSLDCVGILTRKIRDVMRVFELASVYDPKDPTAARPATRTRAFEACKSYLPQFTSTLTGLRIGVPQEYFPAELQPSALSPIRTVLEALKSRGASIIPVSLPSTPYALSAYYVISSAEASSNLARYDGVEYGLRIDLAPDADKTKTANVYAHTRTRGFGKEVQKRILLGTYALSADAFENYFLQAQRVRKLIRADFDRVFCVPNVLTTASTSAVDGVHVLLHPSAIRTAPPLPNDKDSHQEATPDGLDDYVQDVLNVPASLAAFPWVWRQKDEWPMGVSVVGQWGCDEMVLKVGEIIESLQE
ncbi:Glutamyl-tRNA(Gln) amidotransferase subunit A, mitochondrial [Grifola frondosa]|uniref:Glutamyl-tRNA(Gln) amidotransferase subunit A, mitochondrial n=1 Tax=Grifola frondosa TaxID=5627 RepID=A0A1C7MA11_GRIFR|nr:Glutamyl-tRNA(Gln) amidotransferase subunit A, mitochondrial [Grifola frondosa]